MNSFYIPSDMLYLIGLYSQKDYRLISRKCDEKYIEVMKTRRIVVKCNDEEFNSMEWLRYMTNIDMYNIITDIRMETISKFINLKYLVLFRSENITDLSFEYISSMDNLKYLDLSILNNITDLSFEYISSMDNLRSLILYDLEKIGDLSLEYISRMDNLKRIDFLDMEKITNKGVRYLRNMKTLESFELYNCFGVSKRSLKYISQINTLKHLEHGICYTDQDIIEYISKLDNLSSLEITDMNERLSLEPLQNCDLSTLEIWKLNDVQLEEVSQFEGLTYLKITHCQKLSSTGLMNLLKLRNLEELIIVNFKNEISIPMIKQLYKELSLKSLKLARCNISEDVVEYLKFTGKSVEIKNYYHGENLSDITIIEQ